MENQLLSSARIGAQMFARRAFGIRRPLSVQILVTKFCDMTCEMCFTYPIDSREKMKHTMEPSLEQVDNLIQQAADIGAQVIIPFGGEPLIRKDIGEIVAGIKRRGLFCVLYTNATYLPKRIDQLSKVDQLVISVDGDEKTHDSIRGVGSYKRCIEGIELALKHGHSLRLHTVLTKKTLGTLPHMSELAKKYDVMLNYGYTDATEFTLPIAKQFVPSVDETVEFLQKYLAAHDEGVKISTPRSVIRRCIKILREWPIEGHTMTKSHQKQHRKIDIPACGLKNSNLYIDSDGRAMPCLPLWGRSDNPNVYDVGVKSAWDYYEGYKPDGENPCHQCRSVFTIEKGLFYSFSVLHLLEFLQGYEFLSTKRKTPVLEA